MTAVSIILLILLIAVIAVIAGVALLVPALLGGTPVRGITVPRLPGRRGRVTAASLGAVLVAVSVGLFAGAPDGGGEGGGGEADGSRSARRHAATPASSLQAPVTHTSALYTSSLQASPVQAPPVQAPSPDPSLSPETQALISHMPPNLQNCQVPATLPVNALARVECAMGPQIPQFVAYTSYARAEDMNSAYQEGAAGLRLANPDCLGLGDFAAGGQRPYEIPMTGQTGMLRCYQGQGGALVMDWTDDQLNILATAGEEDPQDGDAFLEWVLNEAGPYLTPPPAVPPAPAPAPPQ